MKPSGSITSISSPGRARSERARCRASAPSITARPRSPAAPAFLASSHRNRPTDISLLRPPCSLRGGDIRTQLADQRKCCVQPLAVRRRVEPAVLSGWMGQRNDDRPLTAPLADSLFERAWPNETGDRHLSDGDQHLGLEQLQLGVQPVRAVGDCGGWRPQVSSVLAIAPGEAAHQRRDVGQPAELFGVAKTRAQHPAVELLARASRKRPSRLTFHGTRRLSDEKKRRSPLALESRIGFGDDVLVGAHVASPAGCLMGKQGGARSNQITRARRGFGAAPGMRPRLVMGLPAISLISAVKAIGGAELIAIPTPYE